MSVGPYLYFQGNCLEAMAFYEDVFQTEKPKIMTYGDIHEGGNEMPDSMKKLVLYATMRITSDIVMFSDALPDKPITVGNNVGLIVALDTADYVNAAFDKLKVGGEIIMEIQETFFSKCYACVIDKFGISWQLNLVSPMKD